MKNKALRLTASSVPYIKELRVIAGSMVACLLMQQLDYWFAQQEDGFYKFLEPAPNHPAYRVGDSWCEEMGMTPDEFRTAFDKIGIRYTSRTAYEKARESGDPFAGKCYLSFFSKIEGKTHYRRNHKLVDAELDRIFSSASAGDGKRQVRESNETSDGSGDGEIQARSSGIPDTELVNDVSVESETSVSVSGKIHPDITETTTQITQRISPQTTTSDYTHTSLDNSNRASTITSSLSLKDVTDKDTELLATIGIVDDRTFVASVIAVYPHWQSSLNAVLANPNVRSRVKTAVGTLRNWLSGDGRPEDPKAAAQARRPKYVTAPTGSAPIRDKYGPVGELFSPPALMQREEPKENIREVVEAKLGLLPPETSHNLRHRAWEDLAKDGESIGIVQRANDVLQGRINSSDALKRNMTSRNYYNILYKLLLEQQGETT